jgi:arsenate reductase
MLRTNLLYLRKAKLVQAARLVFRCYPDAVRRRIAHQSRSSPSLRPRRIIVVPSHYNVLFLCTGNSARSIMAEAIMNRKGVPHFTAFSAGSQPKGTVHPGALHELETANFPLTGLRSKSWEEFAQPGAPQLDFVFTVCDNAAKESCPIWPGQPMTAHWGIPDPAAVDGAPQQIEKAFREAFLTLDRRISLFLCLPFSSLNDLAIKKEVDRIGHE